MQVDYAVATDNGNPIVATVRDDGLFTHTDSPALAPLAYPANTLVPGEATLRVRQHEQGAHAEAFYQPAQYYDAVASAAAELQEQRRLLSEDVGRYVAAARQTALGDEV